MTDGEPKPARRAWIGWTIAGVVLLAFIATGWVVVRGIGAVVSLTSAAQSARTLQDDVLANDMEDVDALASRLAADAANARSLTGDPIWIGAELIPGVGTNLRAIRQVSEIADDIASDAVSPFLVAARGADLGTLGITGGHVDFAPLAAVAPQLAQADSVFSAARESTRDIDVDGIFPPLAEAIGELTSAVDKAGKAAATLSGAAQLMPTMLGGTEPRTYLLLMQNNAELRSSGGMPGAMALIHAVDGTITLGTQADTTEFAKASSPVAELRQPVQDLFGVDPGIRIQDSLMPPDFPTAAALAKEQWRLNIGDDVDGVVAMDTVVLRELLAATGPVSVGGVELTADNVIQVLLGDIYRTVPDQNDQNAFFAGTASAIFGTMTRGDADVHSLLGALGHSGEEGRIRVWSATPEEQERIAGTSLSGMLPADTDRDTHVAVLINDTTAAKMDYFADAAVTVREGACGPGGRSMIQVEVQWTSSAPADAATSLPAYVTGDGWRGVPAGIIGTRIAVVGPEGWEAASHSADVEPFETRETVDGERAIVQQELRTPPGATQTVTVDFVSPDRDAAPAAAIVTPMIRDAPVTIEPLSCG